MLAYTLRGPLGIDNASSDFNSKAVSFTNKNRVMKPKPKPTYTQYFILLILLGWIHRADIEPKWPWFLNGGSKSNLRHSHSPLNFFARVCIIYFWVNTLRRAEAVVPCILIHNQIHTCSWNSARSPVGDLPGKSGSPDQKWTDCAQLIEVEIWAFEVDHQGYLLLGVDRPVQKQVASGDQAIGIFNTVNIPINAFHLQ